MPVPLRQTDMLTLPLLIVCLGCAINLFLPFTTSHLYFGILGERWDLTGWNPWSWASGLEFSLKSGVFEISIRMNPN
jgi:hypothetical protein